MNNVPNRVVIYTKDVSNITGLRPKAARKLLCLIREKGGKDKTAFITVDDFAAFTGIRQEVISAFLR